MPKKASTACSFEKSMEELESIVDQMDSDQLPLEQLIAHYERGAKLLADCETTLESAKKRLETISANKGATTQQPSSPASSDDDEIRLF